MRYSTFVRQAELILTRFNNIKASVDTYTAGKGQISNANKSRLISYGQEVTEKYENFQTLLKELISMDDMPDGYDSGQVMKFEDEISDLKIQIESTVKLAAPKQDIIQNQPSNSHTPAPAATIKLPRIQLPSFDGSEPHAWLSFYNIFEQTIHNNAALSPVDKYQYLLSCLSGEALGIIKGLPITTANYLIAFNLLKDRYHNTRRLVTYHATQILDMPSLTHASLRGLRSFIQHYNENAQALNALNHDIEANNIVLVLTLIRKLDSQTRRRFEESRADSSELPTIRELFSFLENECKHLEGAQLGMSSDSHLPSRKPTTDSYAQHRQSIPVDRHSSKPAGNYRVPKTALLQTSKLHCGFCNQGHAIYKCQTFAALAPREKLSFVKNKKWCTNCLSTEHNYKSCTSKYKCKVCQSKHHTSLHISENESVPPDNHCVRNTYSNNNLSADPDSMSQDPSALHTIQSSLVDPVVAVSPNYIDKTVVLATTLAQISIQNGASCVMRGLIDCAAQASFITEHCAQILGVKRMSYPGHIGGISLSQNKTRGLAHLNISALGGKVVASSHPFLILNNITSYLPQRRISMKLKEQLKSFILADPTFDVPAPIDFLLGADLFPIVFTGNRYSLGQDQPVVYSTLFGSVVMGPVSTVEPPAPISLLTVNDSENLRDCLQRFWQLEEPPPPRNAASTEDQFCEDHYAKTVSRNNAGRYIVRLPVKPQAPQLGDSLPTAARRFRSLERQFAARPAMGELYSKFMDEYKETGHMSLCGQIPSNHFFLPHHGVLKESSSTTKLRVVFDASARTSNGFCLNDILLSGPKLQNNITDIVSLFRRHNIVLVCDIRMMFRQLLVHPDDQNLQLILWRDNSTQPLEAFKLQTVTYGLNCSPFLAIRTLKQLVADEGAPFPLASEALNSQIYMDDILTGSDSIEQASELKSELCELLKLGGFELRKWASNCPQLLFDLPEAHKEKPILMKSPDQPLFTILGLYWNQSSDRFCYNVNIKPTAVTKRQALSTLARLYDPCGWLTPVTFLAKVFIQRLWTIALDWDDILPPNLETQWLEFVTELPELQNVSIERNLLIGQASDIRLHGFGDASEQGYAAVVYLRCVTPDDMIKVNILIAKAKVAPLKRVSLPRLELCAAHLLAKLMRYCIDLYSPHMTISSCHAWSDSTIVLAWINTPSYRLKTYVGNRVSEIQELAPAHMWRHVSSEHNPADCASRGVLPSHLPNHAMWWTGPSWLQANPSEWPSGHNPSMTSSDLPELKPVQDNVLVATAPQLDEWDFITRYSSFPKLVRIMGYIVRFINAVKRKPSNGPLTLEDLKHSTLQVCKLVQQSCFPNEIKLLKKGAPCPPRLQRLNPFLDESDIIRVGGRLKHSKLSDDVLHPIVLPKGHHVTGILIDWFHLKHLHAGPQLIQSLISRQFWILSARSIIRSRIFKCLSCFRAKPTSRPPLMGDLPAPRVSIAKPFFSTGMDYSGPHTVKICNLRRVQPVKVYLCIFVCFATKATHIEVVTDLSSNCFIAALTRFVSRRGRCAHLYSDCGTNFVGAATQLKKIIKKFMKDNSKPLDKFFVDQNIEFHFNPPAAPHQGGLWEAAVKSAKHHLTRVIGDHVLTLEEFITLSTQIEAILNSRPLTALSADPSEPAALTPGHFLTSAPLVAVPEASSEDIPNNRLRRWQLVQAFHQRIWRRWQVEYLHTLQQRMKWSKDYPNVSVGDMVLIHDPKCPPLSWPLGRITQVFPGTDGVVRVVGVKTATGTFTRPVVKVYPLPQN